MSDSIRKPQPLYPRCAATLSPGAPILDTQSGKQVRLYRCKRCTFTCIVDVVSSGSSRPDH